MSKLLFKRFGVMLDMSRNGVMKPEELKDFATTLAKMGYNTLLLYTEDTYEIPEEPYFGHMRGRYTQEELRDLVAHCKKLKMEVIPCIQTLAHLEGIFKWPCYAGICDNTNILLAEDERVYALIRNMIRSVKACYDSRHVHVGMDEAHMLGLGKYLDKHGYQNRFQILTRHLEKVCEICREEGLEPNIWSDMFFRLGNNGKYSVDHPHVDPKEIGALPEGLNLTYWDYYSTGKRRYGAMFRAHKKLSDRLWFAGGIWTWKGWAPDNRHSVNTCLPGLTVAAREGVENAFVTLWGDNGGECSRYASLPALFTVARFAQGETDRAKIRADFEKEFGISYRFFMNLDLKFSGKTPTNPEKYLLYQDPFLGVMDSTLHGGESAFYKNQGKKLARIAKNERFGKIFDAQAALARTLSYKAELGARSRKAYQADDREAGKALLKDYTLAIRNLKSFIQKATDLWLWENKPQGLEQVQVRLGGLVQRLEFCKARFADWVENGTEIPELAEKALDYFGGGEDFDVKHIRATQYLKYFSPSRQ